MNILRKKLTGRSSNLLFAGNFFSDFFWNFSSLLILGASGIFLNIAIGKWYGAASLGNFNIVFAVYLVLSQLSVFGVHFSTLKHVSENEKDGKICKEIISSALVVAVVTASFFSAIILVFHRLLIDWLKGSDISAGLLYIIPSLIFFSLNKVFLAALNAMRQMRLFAMFNAVRYLLFIFFLIFFILEKKPAAVLPQMFVFSEMILFAALVLYFLTSRLLVFPNNLLWLKKHCRFGYQSFISGISIEANSRIDILILGFFASSAVVGIYSFAAMAVEGISQIAIALRTVINPMLARKSGSSQKEELAAAVREGSALLYRGMFVISLLALIGYPLSIELLLPGTEFMKSLPAFIILLAGFTASFGYLPFNMLLLQTGYPAQYTRMILTAFVANIFLNLALIPFFGMFGAAAATAVFYIFSVALLKIFVLRVVKINI